MANIESSLLDIGRMDALSSMNTPIHRLDPRAKLLATALFILTVVSFNKYEITGLVPFFFYPLLLVSLGNLPPLFLLRKIAIVAPFAVFVGVFNPILDREIVISIGSYGVSGGWISFLSIMIKFVLTVGSVLILIASTGFNSVCMAIEKLGSPRAFAVQLLFLYRYIFVLAEEGSRMLMARSLRTFGKAKMGAGAFSAFAGYLLLRTLDRAHRIHLAMKSRGFDGNIRIMRRLKMGYAEWFFVLGWSVLFILMRIYNVPELLGGLITGGRS